MVIWQEPAPPPSVSEASSVSADPVYVGPRCRRGHPMPGQRCRACYEAERGPRRGAQQPANQYETAVADGWTAEQG